MTIVAQETKVFCIPCMANGKPIILFERVQNVVFIRIHKREWSLVTGVGGRVRTACPNCSRSVTISLDSGVAIV